MLTLLILQVIIVFVAGFQGTFNSHLSKRPVSMNAIGNFFKNIFTIPEPEPYDAPFKLPEEIWKTKLNNEAYYVLRQAGTERPWTSPLNDEKRQGTFQCAGCGADLFASQTKFNSGTGWPSFYKPKDSSSIVERVDTMLGMTRTEVLCTNCGGHLGHVFKDGPRPTGLRYCINGVSLKFSPEVVNTPDDFVK